MPSDANGNGPFRHTLESQMILNGMVGPEYSSYYRDDPGNTPALCFARNRVTPYYSLSCSKHWESVFTLACERETY
ncbi:MAG: hypothetical protein N3G20_00290 [Verrucomicrobiae bacterium]|nr:hypothetical protein [Verrucomicrobiae bacterium]